MKIKLRPKQKRWREAQAGLPRRAVLSAEQAIAEVASTASLKR